MGTNNDIEEYRCNANFDVINKDVLCVIESDVDIGNYRCVSLRNGGSDGLDLTKVR